MREQCAAQAGDAHGRLTVGHRALGIHVAARFADAPGADRVEILQREAEPIHRAVTARARRVGAVALQPLADRTRLGACRLLEGRHVRRRRRRRRAEQVLENPLAAQCRRRAVGVRGGQQDAALAQQPAARLAGQRHAAELRAVDARQAVVLGQPLVHEGVVGGHQVEHVAIFAHDAAEEELGLAAEGVAQIVVEVGELVGVGRDVLQVADVQPLPGEVLHQRDGLGVGEHAAHLRLEHRRLRADGPPPPDRAACRPACCSRGRTTGATPARRRSRGTACPARRPPDPPRRGRRTSGWRAGGAARAGRRRRSCPSCGRHDRTPSAAPGRDRSPAAGTHGAPSVERIRRAHGSSAAWPSQVCTRTRADGSACRRAPSG